MKYLFAVTVFLVAMVFSVLGAWLGDDLGMIAVEVGLDSGVGDPLDYLAIILLDILIIPFVFVLSFSPPLSMLLFALNGACWACLFWALWKIGHRIKHGKRQHNQKL